MKFGFLGDESVDTIAVLAAFDNLGWERVRGPGWDALWSYSMRGLRRYLPQLTPTQRINHLPGSRHYAGKLGCRSIDAFRERHGLLDDPDWDFFPPAFRLPEDREAFDRARARNPDWIWLVKPNRGATMGRGLRLPARDEPTPEGSWLLQRLVEDPHLIDGRKYSLRVLVLLASADPLIVLAHRDPSLVLTHEPYALDCDAPEHARGYVVNGALETQILGSPRLVRRLSMEDWRETLRADGADPDRVRAGIIGAIAGLFRAAHSGLAASVRQSVPGRLNGFEVLGFDFLIDSRFRPWIIECNLNPSHPDRAEVRTRLADTLAMVGIHADRPPPPSPASGDAVIADDPRDPAGLDALCREGFDWRAHEAAHAGGYQRVLPLPD